MPLYQEVRSSRELERIRYNLRQGARKLADQIAKGPAFPIAGTAAEVWLKSMMDILDLGPLGYFRKASLEAMQEIDYALSTGKVPNPEEVRRKATLLLNRALEGPESDARKAKDALQRLRVRAMRYTY